MATPKLNPTFIDKNNLDASLVNDSPVTKTDEQIAMEATFAENQKLKAEIAALQETIALSSAENLPKLRKDDFDVNQRKVEKRIAVLDRLLTGAAAAGQLYGPTINQQALDKALSHYIGLAEIIVDRITKRWN